MSRPIRMNIAMVGDGYSLSPGQEIDLDDIIEFEPGAAAWVTEPEDEPRATALGWSHDDTPTAKPKASRAKPAKPSEDE